MYSAQSSFGITFVSLERRSRDHRTETIKIFIPRGIINLPYRLGRFHPPSDFTICKFSSRNSFDNCLPPFLRSVYFTIGKPLAGRKNIFVVSKLSYVGSYLLYTNLCHEIKNGRAFTAMSKKRCSEKRNKISSPVLQGVHRPRTSTKFRFKGERKIHCFDPIREREIIFEIESFREFFHEFDEYFISPLSLFLLSFTGKKYYYVEYYSCKSAFS